VNDWFDQQRHLWPLIVLAFDAGTKDDPGFALDHVCGEGWGDLEVANESENYVFHLKRGKVISDTRPRATKEAHNVAPYSG